MSFEETGQETIYRGVKQGMIKESFDRILSTLAKPLVEKIKPSLIKSNPNVDFLDPAIESGLEFATMQVLSELLRVSGPIVKNLPGMDQEDFDTEEKVDAISRAMRGYSGERLGDKAGQAAVALLPLVKQFFTDASAAGILNTQAPQRVLEKKQNRESLIDKLNKNG